MFLLFVFAITGVLLCPADTVDSVLRVLDSEIERAPLDYVAPKEALLGRLRDRYKRSSSEISRFDACHELFDEYRFFQYDSAYSYARLMERLADKTGDSLRIMQARTALMECFSTVGFFNEALGVGRTIDPSLLPEAERIDFYLSWAKLNQNMESFVAGSSDLYQNYVDMRRQLYQKVLGLADPASYEYATASLELERIRSYAVDETITHCKSIIDNFDLDNHQKAINYSTIGISYMVLNRPDSAAYYLALSAINDLRSNTRETTAAKDLATIMHDKGDVERAGRYIHQALADAEGYNSRFRKVEINGIMPLIENARHLRLTEQRLFLLVAAIIFAAMLTAMIFLFFKLKKRNRSLTESHREIREKTLALENSNTALADVNTRLREATEIKDQYIIQTLYSNSDFVNEVEEKTRRALLKLKGRQYGELGSILSDMGVRREQARMYASFDSAFLKLFPNFVEEFNKLMLPDQGISLSGGRLPTDVRIFALMRLGITATSDIAQYLCLSVNTVYVYKAKVKARAAVDKNAFDEAVMAIPKP